MSVLIKIVVVVVLIYAALALGTRYLQRRLMYFPDAERVSPASLDLKDVREVEFEAGDGVKLIAWSGAAQPGRPTLLYFHGNGGSPATRSERIRKYMARGYGMFMLGYRGFGGSEGEPSEAANVADAKLAYEVLVKSGVAPQDIVVYGESLGSGVAAQVAAEKPVGGVILDAPYTSMVDLARLHYSHLPRWLMTDRYETSTFIPRVSAPLLVVHGEEDDIIPVAMGRAVYAAKPGEKEIATFPGAGHSDHYMFGSYDRIFGWLERHWPKNAARAAG